MGITIKMIPFSALEESPDRFNTTYHEYAELPPALQLLESERTASDMDGILAEKAYSVFVPFIHSLRSTAPDYHHFLLSAEDCAVLERTAKVALSLNDGQISQVDDVDLEMIARRISRTVQCFDGTRQWFARMEAGSPKNGRGGVGPFTDARQVLNSICTSKRTWDYLKRVCKIPGATETLHFLPWREDIDPANEFRMFVPPSGRVRAISEYHVSGKWAAVEVEGVEHVVRKMLECHEAFREKAQNVLPTAGYTIDLHCTQDDTCGWTVEAIEVNMFGAQNGAGSCLFNWVEDWQTLYGLSDELQVRLLHKE